MTRLVSGVVLAAAALAAILFLPTTGLRLVACAVAALAAIEYLRIVSGLGLDPVFAFVAVMCWFMAEPGAGALMFRVLAVGIVVVEVLLKNQPIATVTARYFAVLYIAVPLGLLVAIHTLAGREAVLLLIATIVVSDSSQYYTGRMFGRHALAPTISPKKTIEGAVGGVMIGAAFLVVAGRFVFPMAQPSLLLAMGLSTVVLGIAGDLFESKLKRVAGVKDSSALIPGHGGVLDRIDALLFAGPAAYFAFVALAQGS
jgi:phosphatidate cytidylyltransferase